MAHEFTSKRARLRDGELHYIDEGRGPPIVFVHGTPTNSYEYRHLIGALRGRYRCLALDHLGFGESDRPPLADYTPEAHAARFAEWMALLDLPACILVVHDFGGPIALPWAAAHPERVAKLVLINTWIWSFDGDRAMQRGARFAGSWFGRLLYRYLNASLRVLMPAAYGDRRRLTREIHQKYLACFPDPDSRERVLHRLARALLESREHLERLWQARGALAGVPMLIVWGLADGALPKRFFERLRATFPAARTLALPDAGHWPHEEEPEPVIAALVEFAADVSESSARTPRASVAPPVWQ